MTLIKIHCIIIISLYCKYLVLKFPAYNMYSYLTTMYSNLVYLPILLTKIVYILYHFLKSIVFHQNCNSFSLGVNKLKSLVTNKYLL